MLAKETQTSTKFFASKIFLVKCLTGSRLPWTWSKNCLSVMEVWPPHPFSSTRKELNISSAINSLVIFDLSFFVCYPTFYTFHQQIKVLKICKFWVILVILYSNIWAKRIFSLVYLIIKIEIKMNKCGRISVKLSTSFDQF